MKKIAQYISRIFSPIIETPLIIWLATNLNLTYINSIKIFLISLVFLYLLPWSFFLHWKLKIENSMKIAKLKIVN